MTHGQRRMMLAWRRWWHRVEEGRRLEDEASGDWAHFFHEISSFFFVCPKFFDFLLFFYDLCSDLFIGYFGFSSIFCGDFSNLMTKMFSGPVSARSCFTSPSVHGGMAR